MKIKNVDPFGEEDWLDEKLITKFQIFEEITQFKEGNLKIIYRDNNLTVVIPKTSEASAITTRGTRWCSGSPPGYDMLAKRNILFRFLFKDGYKLRLTWEIEGEYFSWGSGGEKYYKILGNHPFDDIKNMENEIKKEFNSKLENPSYNELNFDPKDYEDNMEKYNRLTDEQKNSRKIDFYKGMFNTKKEIIKKIKEIPEEAKLKVIKYRDEIKKRKRKR